MPDLYAVSIFSVLYSIAVTILKIYLIIIFIKFTTVATRYYSLKLEELKINRYKD